MDTWIEQYKCLRGPSKFIVYMPNKCIYVMRYPPIKLLRYCDKVCIRGANLYCYQKYMVLSIQYYSSKRYKTHGVSIPIKQYIGRGQFMINTWNYIIAKKSAPFIIDKILA